MNIVKTVLRCLNIWASIEIVSAFILAIVIVVYVISSHQNQTQNSSLNLVSPTTKTQ